MSILVTVDSNYLLALKVMLFSLFRSNPSNEFHIFLMYSEVLPDEIEDLKNFIYSFSQRFTPVAVSEELLSGVRVNSYYSKAMYYRLLAFEVLPAELEKALYLDPDILVINPIEPLYRTDVSSHLWGACAHNSALVDGITKVRLKTPELERYFNSGVLLMNLEKQRKEVNVSDIFDYVKKNHDVLVLPDQDVLNALYGDRILLMDDSLYNFDVRKSNSYLLASLGEKDMDWLVTHTVILHYCGKQKPWKKKYSNRYGLLYKHYQKLTESYSRSLGE